MTRRLAPFLLAAGLLCGAAPVTTYAQAATVGATDTVQTLRGRWCENGSLPTGSGQCSPSEAPRLEGHILFDHVREGRLIEHREIHNLVVSAGAAGIASRINGSGAEAAFTFIAIGTGTTAAAAGDTTLQTEITTNGGARAACTTSRVTTDVTNDTAQCVLTYSFTGAFAVTESGYLNAASAGTLLSRQVFSAINVASGDSLQITWKIDVD